MNRRGGDQAPAATGSPAGVEDPVRRPLGDPAALVHQALAGQVAPYERLGEVHVADTLRSTPSGKLLRRLLAADPVPA